MEGRALRQKRARVAHHEADPDSSSSDFSDAAAEPDYSDDEDSRRGRLAVRWEGQIEARFLRALQQAGGVWEAKPKAILQKMGAYASQLTTIQVKSHLQKHRIKVAAEMQRTGATVPAPAGADAPAPLAAARAAAAAQAAAAAARQASAAAGAQQHKAPRQPKAAGARQPGTHTSRGPAPGGTSGRPRKQPKQQAVAVPRQQPQHAPSTPQRMRFEVQPAQQQTPAEHAALAPPQPAAHHMQPHPHAHLHHAVQHYQQQQQHLMLRQQQYQQQQQQQQRMHHHQLASAASHHGHSHSHHHMSDPALLAVDPAFPGPHQDSPLTAVSGGSSSGAADAWEAGLMSVSVSCPVQFSAYGSAAHQHAYAHMQPMSPVRHGSLMRAVPAAAAAGLAHQPTAPAAFWGSATDHADATWVADLGASPHQHHALAHAAMTNHYRAPAPAPAAPAPADPTAGLMAPSPGLLVGGDASAGVVAPHTSDSDSDHFNADIAELLDMPPAMLMAPISRPGADPLFGYGLEARHTNWALDSGIF